MKNTIVISAFPACGKSYAFNNFQDSYSILDSDSSKFDKTYFPDNYIKHIKENLGKVDIIFVSSHQVVREALTNNDIRFVTIYPDFDCKDDWLKRMKDRGNTEAFINQQDSKWNEWVKNVFPFGLRLYRLHKNQFITLSLLASIINYANSINI